MGSLISFLVFLRMVAENDIQNVPSGSNDCEVHIIMIYILFILGKPLSEPSCPVDEGRVNQEETTHFRFRLEEIIQPFVWICGDGSL